MREKRLKEEERDEPVSGGRQILLMVEYAIVVFGLLLGVCWYRASNIHAMPDDLVGTYHTSTEAYADRALEIDSVSINFVTGEGKVSVGMVNNVQMRLDEGKRLYTVSYTADDLKSQVSFYYEPGKADTIRFKNQTAIEWTKDKKEKL